MDALEPPKNPVFNGANLLSMAYANGKGARRNIDIALKLMCSQGYTYCAERLVELKATPNPIENFTVCDCAAGTVGQGFCDGLAEELKAQARAARRAALTATWTPAEKTVFSQLERSRNAFFEARERNEVDLTGTARASMQIEERATLEDEFMAALEQFESGKLPEFSARESAGAQNAERRAFTATQKRMTCGTVTSAGIRRTEQAWRSYVAAWLAVGSLKYRRASSDSLKGWLADERRKMLEEFLGCAGQPHGK